MLQKKKTNRFFGGIRIKMIIASCDSMMAFLENVGNEQKTHKYIRKLDLGDLI